MKINYVCPYCSRKITYFTRLTEHNLGEHECKHCKKKSNIKQDKNMWLLLIGAIAIALIIMLLYFIFAKSVNFANEENGSYGFLCFLFFGSGYEIKWLLWEMTPFIAFYFLAPMFMTFSPQKRFVEQTTTSIDLNVPGVPMVTGSFPVVDGNTRVIPKADEIGEYSGTYEDISSSSDMGRTRAFDVNNISAEQAINITKPKTSTSASYRDSEPLKKITHNEEVTVDKNDEVRVDWDSAVRKYKREEDPVKKYMKDQAEKGNFSANRKF